MIRRLIFLAIAAYALFAGLRRLFAQQRQPTGGGRAGRQGETPARGVVGGPMVRDRICNTFVPREGALRLTDGTGEHFFCSEACREAHQTRVTASRG